MTAKPDMLDMLLKYAQKPRAYDASGYPQDVQATILIICELWQMPPPKYKKDKAYWIEGARRVIDACGEFGVELIRAYHAEKYLLMENPLTIASPGSLVNVLRAFAGEKRILSNGGNRAQRERAEARKYVTGEFAAFIEH